MVRTVEEAKKAAGSKSTVLLLGESGTGKEIFARAIHDWSRSEVEALYRRSIVSALPKSFWKASYSVMRRAHSPEPISSKKEKSNWPTAARCFWTRSAISPRSFKTKLLRFLQEREFERVGGTEPITVDVRIIAATNRDLEQSGQERNLS